MAHVNYADLPVQCKAADQIDQYTRYTCTGDVVHASVSAPGLHHCRIRGHYLFVHLLNT